MIQNNFKRKFGQAAYFAVVLVGIFGLTYLALYLSGLVPTNLRVEKVIEDEDLPKSEEVLPATYSRPERIIIESARINVPVVVPGSVQVNVLDEALTRGAVYYPGSGTIERGNIFIFGHSTNWPVVQNPAYKTFNGLEKLQKGDEIKIESKGEFYTYKVDTVDLVDADNALVEFDNSGQTLTLSTCNTFGEKQERWVVTASRDI